MNTHLQQWKTREKKTETEQKERILLKISSQETNKTEQTEKVETVYQARDD